jgi:4-hydroxy-2-oxoglutarate aldolase
MKGIMDLGGIIPPLPTPFAGDRVDIDRFRENLEHWMGWEGMSVPEGPGPFRLSGVLVAGSNGEAPLLEQEEVDALVKVAREVVPSDRLLLMGTGRQSTAAARFASRRAAVLGADAVLVGTSNYFRRQLHNDDLIAHFEAVAAAVRVPVIMYSVPRFAGFDIPVAAIKRLASNPAIAGIKDSSGDTGRVVEILAGDHPVQGDGFRVMAGNATVFYPALACGAAGGILAVANVVPGLACALLNAWEANDQDAARRIQKRLTPLARAVTVEYGIAGLKEALDLIGLYGGAPRAPLRLLDRTDRAELSRILEHALWAEGEEMGGGSRLVDLVKS